MVRAFSSFSIILQIFTWGYNDHGQLGLNDGTAYYLAPKKVANLNDIVMKKIICGSTYVLALNDVCELYVWGSNANGELGLGDTVDRGVPVKNEAVGR